MVVSSEPDGDRICRPLLGQFQVPKSGAEKAVDRARALRPPHAITFTSISTALSLTSNENISVAPLGG